MDRTSIRKRKDVFGNLVILAIIVMFCLLCLYPILNALAVSLNDSADSSRGGITIFPRVVSFENYSMLLADSRIPRALMISLARTVSGTILSLVVTGLFAYGMSRKKLMFKKFYMTLCIVAMYFTGGLIPYYVLINKIGLTNNFLVYIVPGAAGIFNMIIMRTFFSQIPDALEESAYIDGAGPYTVFFHIIFPLSAPVFATIALFVGVGQWNSWLDAALFMTKNNKLLPMQNILIQVINTSTFYQDMLQKAGGPAGDMMEKMQRVSVRSMRMAVMIITIVPILLVYPFLQKYFMKGVMIGSIKG